MDTWQEDQIKRMQTGGNSRFMDFMRSYTPQEQGGYSDSASSYDRYHCWAATQYRQKVSSTTNLTYILSHDFDSLMQS